MFQYLNSRWTWHFDCTCNYGREHPSICSMTIWLSVFGYGSILAISNNEHRKKNSQPFWFVVGLWTEFCWACHVWVNSSRHQPLPRGGGTRQWRSDDRGRACHQRSCSYRHGGNDLRVQRWIPKMITESWVNTTHRPLFECSFPLRGPHMMNPQTVEAATPVRAYLCWMEIYFVRHAAVGSIPSGSLWLDSLHLIKSRDPWAIS